jgi:hypothetical protein
MDLKQNVVHKLNLEFGKDVKSIEKSHSLYKKLQEEKNSIEKSVSYFVTTALGGFEATRTNLKFASLHLE